jgi:hypothetical protein
MKVSIFGESPSPSTMASRSGRVVRRGQHAFEGHAVTPRRAEP